MTNPILFVGEDGGHRRNLGDHLTNSGFKAQEAAGVYVQKRRGSPDRY